MAIRQALEVDVRVDQPGPCGAAQANDLGVGARCTARLRTDADDPSVRTRRDLWLTASKQDRLHL